MNPKEINISTAQTVPTRQPNFTMINAFAKERRLDRQLHTLPSLPKNFSIKILYFHRGYGMFAINREYKSHEISVVCACPHLSENLNLPVRMTLPIMVSMIIMISMIMLCYYTSNDTKWCPCIFILLNSFISSKII